MAAVPAIFLPSEFFFRTLRHARPGFRFSVFQPHGIMVVFFVVFTSAYPKAAFYFQPGATGKRQNGMQVAFLLTNSNPMKPTLF